MHIPGNWAGLPCCWWRELVTATSWTCPVIDHVERLQRRSNGQPSGWNVWGVSQTDATLLLMTRKTPSTGKCWGPVLFKYTDLLVFLNMGPYSMRIYFMNCPQRWIRNHMTECRPSIRVIYFYSIIIIIIFIIIIIGWVTCVIRPNWSPVKGKTRPGRVNWPIWRFYPEVI